MTLPRGFVPTISLNMLFVLATLGIGMAQTDFITTPVYQPQYGYSLPNQKAIAVGSDGFVRFVTGDSTSGGWNDAVTYVRCLDQDCVSSHTATFPGGGESDSIALGPNGFARIAYRDGDILGFVQCADDDCASFTNVFVDYASDNGVGSIAVGSDGTSYIVYDYWNDEDESQGVGLATCTSGGCSTTHIANVSVYDAIGAVITMGADGNPVIVYEDSGNSWDTPDSVHYYANGTDTVISSDGNGNTYTHDAAIGPDGFARVVFTSLGVGADIIHCTNLSCSASSSAAISFSGVYTPSISVAVGADGNPIVQAGSVEEGGSATDIDYIRCTTSNCSTYSDEVVPGAPWNANVVSMALGLDGFPRMMTQDTDAMVYQVRTAAPCPASVTLSTTTQLSLEDNFPQFETGLGILTAMQVNPATKSDGTNWNGTQITEDVNVNNIDTCPASVQACHGRDTFTVGTGGGTTFGQPFSAQDNIFWDEHVRAASTSLLNAPGVTTTSCTMVCSQTYQCNGHTIGSFTIVYGLSTGTIDGTPVTNVSVTKQ